MNSLMKGKRAGRLLRLTALLLAAALLVPFALPEASAAGTVTVTGSSVNVRKGAGTGYAVVATVKKGETYPCLGEAKDASGLTWYNIRVSSAVTGYITGSYAVKSASGAPEGGQAGGTADGTVTVTGNTVNVRKGAGTSYASVATVKKWQTYPCLGQAKDAAGTVWYNIRVSTAVTGYIISTYASLSASGSSGSGQAGGTADGTVTVTGNTVNVRKGAGTSYASVATVKKWQTYPCLGQAKDAAGTVWYNIRVSSTVTGYIIGTYASYSASGSSGSGQAGGTAGGTVTVTGNTVNVRKGAGTSYASVATVKKWQTYPCLGQAKDAAGTVWYNIRVSSTVSGYIIGTYASYSASGSSGSGSTGGSTGGTVMVTGLEVNVRTGAGTSYPDIASVKKNGLYPYLGQAKGTDGTVWYKIRVSDTVSGYVSSVYTVYDPTGKQKPEVTKPDPARGGTVTVTGGTVNVRKGAGTNYGLAASVSKGQKYPCLGQAKDASGTVWYRILISATVTGYICGSYASWSAASSGQLIYISPSKQWWNKYADGVTTEKDNMCAIGKIVAQMLEDAGCLVELAPDAITREEAVQQANADGAAIYVALHSNAGDTPNSTTRGCEVWIRPDEASSLNLARKVYAEVSAVTPTADRGIKYSSGLYELVHPDAATAFLIETDFHDNAEGCYWLKTNRWTIAAAIARGILAYMGK